jgi:hypothetical protein
MNWGKFSKSIVRTLTIRELIPLAGIIVSCKQAFNKDSHLSSLHQPEKGCQSSRQVHDWRDFTRWMQPVMHYQPSVRGMWSSSYQKFTLPAFSRSNSMSPEIDTDLRSQDQESSVASYQTVVDMTLDETILHRRYTETSHQGRHAFAVCCCSHGIRILWSSRMSRRLGIKGRVLHFTVYMWVLSAIPRYYR